MTPYTSTVPHKSLHPNPRHACMLIEFGYPEARIYFDRTLFSCMEGMITGQMKDLGADLEPHRRHRTTSTSLVSSTGCIMAAARRRSVMGTRSTKRHTKRGMLQKGVCQHVGIDTVGAEAILKGGGIARGQG